MPRELSTEVLDLYEASSCYTHSRLDTDLKPENLLFRNSGDDADVMITDFGLSVILDEGKADKVTEVCGTVAYMAPEIFKKSKFSSPILSRAN